MFTETEGNANLLICLKYYDICFDKTNCTSSSCTINKINCIYGVVHK